MIFFLSLWWFFDGCTNRAMHGQSCQPANFKKIAKIAPFNPWMQLKNIFGHITYYIWHAAKSALNLAKICIRLGQSAPFQKIILTLEELILFWVSMNICKIGDGIFFEGIYSKITVCEIFESQMRATFTLRQSVHTCLTLQNDYLLSKESPALDKVFQNFFDFWSLSMSPLLETKNFYFVKHICN